MIFIETPTFTRKITELLTDFEYSLLQHDLARNPKPGKVMRGTGGVRKKRWPYKDTGKRGGLRIMYYCISNERLLMLYVYKKSDEEDLSREQIGILKSVVEEELK